MKRLTCVLVFLLALSAGVAMAKAPRLAVNPASVAASSADLTIVPAADFKFVLDGETLSVRQLKKALKKRKNLKLVYVSGDPTVGHLLEAAKIADRLGFEVLYGDEGDLKTIKVVD